MPCALYLRNCQPCCGGRWCVTWCVVATARGCDRRRSIESHPFADVVSTGVAKLGSRPRLNGAVVGGPHGAAAACTAAPRLEHAVRSRMCSRLLGSRMCSRNCLHHGYLPFTAAGHRGSGAGLGSPLGDVCARKPAAAIDSLPVDTATPATVTLTVWPDDEHQTILGFGGAITQASGVVWRRLSKPLQKRVVDLFFGEDGLRASLARVPIGSCDFAESSYSADDVNKATVSLKWTK
jgi:hypothetical protein